LSARAVGASVQYSYTLNGSTLPVNPGDTVSFAPIATGQTETLQFSVTNNGTAPAPIVSVGTLDTKGIFRVTGLPALPIQVQPGASASFGIVFSPQSPGLSTSTLVVNNQTFTLAGFSSLPPALPTFHFTGATGSQAAFQQLSVGLSLDAPYPLPLSGTLTLAELSALYPADPAVQFAVGGPQVAFTIPANTLAAIFPGGATQVRLQTGTVAASIQISAKFTVGGANGTDITPTTAPTLVLTVPSAAPTVLTAGVVSVSANQVVVGLTGFSTTRALDHLSFSFAASSGFTISPTSVTVDVSNAAKLWFQGATSQTLGGEFSIEVPFTLSSGATADLSKGLTSITISATNEVGTSNTVQIPVP
jgi:hypothetical protein